MIVTLRGRRNLRHEERLSAYTSRLRLDVETECRLWTGKVGNHGYGVVSIQGSDRLIHQYFYEQETGERPPSGSNLHHLCGVKTCCNVDHLELVTVAEHDRRHPDSILTAVRASAKNNSEKATCIHGHPFTTDNTYINSLGHRKCRTCNRERSRRLRGA